MQTNQLEHILSPITVARFFEDYYQKDMLHVSRNDSSFYNSILSATEISQFLDRQDIYYPSLRIVKNGQEIPSAQYTLKGVPIGHHKKDGIIQTEKAFKLFNAGSTLVIQAGQRYFDHLSKCCLDLSNHFKAPVQANLYITPNKSVGFNPHWDTHDVFVLQISGTKTWHLYGSEMKLPIKGQSFVAKGYDKPPLQTIQIQPGDLLYVPRGYVHDAVADDGISAHITIGILSYTWIRFFNEALLQLAQDASFREAVPLWDEQLPHMIQEKIEALKTKLDTLDYQLPIDNLSKHHKATQPQPLQHYFGSLLQLPTLDGQQKLATNRALILGRKKEETQIVLEFLGKKIVLPLEAEKFLDTILRQESFSMDALDMEIKQEWVSTLVKEGLLYFVA